MSVILANGCFDVFHEGHKHFLMRARALGSASLFSLRDKTISNHLIVCVNSDESAKRLKATKWGERYPIDSLERRMQNVSRFADEVIAFDTEEQLYEIVAMNMPCIIAKGPDYVGKHVTGESLAPVLILDTPEPESVKAMKQMVYFGLAGPIQQPTQK